jgi:HD-GYP domain-containing protein (c-di-GMP phosphodiesterase class II)
VRRAIVLGVLAVFTVLMLFGPGGSHEWAHPELLFSLVAVTAVASVVAATVTIAIGDRRDEPEIGLLGTMLLSASVLPLVHGLTTPGVLFDSSEAFRTSSYLTMPIALAVGSPLLAPHSAFGRWASRKWRDWTLMALLGVFVFAAMIVFVPDWIVMPDPAATSTLALTAIAVLAMLALAARQMRFYDLGRRPANLIVSVSLVMLAVAACAPLSDEYYSVGFWWVHVAGAAGVIGACVGLTITRRMDPSANEVLAPVLARDPLVAFELGLSPVVHGFVADIAMKDALTRDHVARTAELAMRVGERFRMSTADLRDLGLAALLHDVGKVNVPDSILKKPARLSDAEYEVMKLHPVDGEAMLAAEPTLATAARVVRSHHERFDGCGYPDGLVGREIPLASRIIAACDALDAMTNDRQYRRAMPTEMACAILREHAGSQWDEQVVQQVVTVVASMPRLRAFEEVGRRARGVTSESVPDDIGELLVTLDAEI